ncbi:MAG: primosomal replication protein N [Lautropia sp.]
MVTLTALLTERAMIRYSPAGVPVLECRLMHRSLQQEAGLDRQVEFEIGAVALGELTATLDTIDPGTALAVEGFLAPSRKGARQLLLHLTRIEIADAATAAILTAEPLSNQDLSSNPAR